MRIERYVGIAICVGEAILAHFLHEGIASISIWTAAAVIIGTTSNIRRAR